MTVARTDIKPAFPEGNVPVVLSTDAKYLPYLKVVIRSIAASAKGRSIDVIVLHSGLERESIDAVVGEFTGSYGISVRFVDVLGAADAAGMEGFVPTGHFSVATCYKLLAPDVLVNYDKLIILDIDVAVNHDLAELFETDLEGCLFGAVRDAIGTGDTEQFFAWVAENGLDDARDYVNAGVYLVDCAQYRREHLAEKLAPAAVRYSRAGWLNEQDAINFDCKGRIKHLDPRWNVQVGDYCIKQQMKATGGEAYIAHFTGAKKPWNTPEHAMAHLWWRHAGEDGTILWRTAFKTDAEDLAAGDGIAVSVVVPIYNAALYLPQMLVSLSAQTLRNIEIICVDDGSTDASAAVVAEFAARDPRIRMVSQVNSGAAVARNRGMVEARGRWLFFADADDFCRPDLLADMVAKGDRDYAEIVVAGRLVIDSRQPVSSRELPVPRKVLGRTVNGSTWGVNIFARVGFAPWNKLYSREFVRRSGKQYHQTPPNDDVFFVLSTLATARRVVFVDKAYYYYRSFLPTSQTGRADANPENLLVALREVRDVVAGCDASVRKAFFRVAVSACFETLRLCRSPEGRQRMFSAMQDGGLAALRMPSVTVDEDGIGACAAAYAKTAAGFGMGDVIGTYCDDRCEALSARSVAAESKAASLERRLANCERRLENSSRSLEAERENVQKLKADLAKSQDAERVIGERCRKEVAALRSRCADLQACVQSLEEADSACRKHLKCLKMELTSTRESRDECMKRMRVLAVEVLRLRNSCPGRLEK